MLEYRSIHAAATDKVAALARETAHRGAVEAAHLGNDVRVKRSPTLFWARIFLTH